MRKKSTIEPQYQVGTTRSELKFAWWWKKIGDIKIIFEKYEVLYVYEIAEHTGLVNGQPLKFKTPEWVKVSEALIIK